MEDDLNFFDKEERKIFLKMEDDLNLFEKERQANFFENGRQPQKK